MINGDHHDLTHFFSIQHDVRISRHDRLPHVPINGGVQSWVGRDSSEHLSNSRDEIDAAPGLALFVPIGGIVVLGSRCGQ
jgi:hypothetical protein